MRLRTIKNRFKHSGIPLKYILEVHEKLKGFSDDSIKPNEKNNDYWIEIVKEIFEKFQREVRDEIFDFHRLSG